MISPEGNMLLQVLHEVGGQQPHYADLDVEKQQTLNHIFIIYFLGT